jgi:cytochrome c oxidase subunit II
LRSHDDRPAGRGHSRRVGLAVIAIPGAVLLLSGCSRTLEQGWLPAPERDTTNQTGRIIDMWVGSWIAALAVGVLVWGLAIWCMIAYRRRRDETGLPPQVQYHVPLEILYTVVPLMMVAVLFYFTARDQAAIASTSTKPDLVIGVVGKQWSWDFNYIDSNVYDTGVHAQLDKPGVEDELPTLYLPVDERVQFDLTARDVIHSFWIPAFLYKMDVIPGVTNHFQVIPRRIGLYQGKCAELCGEHHSEMLFAVKVVSRADYDSHMAELRAKGQTGLLTTQLGRSDAPGSGASPGSG